MTDFQLDAQSSFSSQPQSFNGITITAVEEISIVSLATPNGGADALAKAIHSAYQTDPPSIGQSASSPQHNALFIRLAQDQMFVIFGKTSNTNPTSVVYTALDQTAYLTDQSDSWAALRIQGPACRSALERICSLDLHPDSFAIGQIARTMMEHLGIILIREATETFLLLSARSSADNFLDAIETSARNVT